jgi:hypothetical protein
MTVQLAPGEAVIWEGRPSGMRGFIRGIDLFWIAFATFGALFFVTSLAATSRSPRPDGGEFVAVALFPFVVFGLFLGLPRAIGIWREKQRARYVLTDRRIILESRGRTVELDLRALPYLEFERSWLAGPAIYFAQRNIYEGWGAMYGGSPAPAFRGLANAEDVYRLISDTRAKALAR